jgi:hypothetical protein
VSHNVVVLNEEYLFMNKFTKLLKAFWGWCVGRIRMFFKHPYVVKVIVMVSGGFLLWVLKLLTIALLSAAGIALPAF